MMHPGVNSCLVLGGKGFVGSALVAEAQRRGYRTTVVDQDDYATAVGTACDLLINANGNSKKFLAAQDPKLEFDLSVRSVARSLQDFKAGCYVFLSSMDVYFPHVRLSEENAETKPLDMAQQSPYGFHKALAEELVRYYAHDWLIFRMAGFVGRGLWKNSIHDLLTGQPLRVHPDSSYQYLDTAALAHIVLDMAAKAEVHNELFNIAGEGLVSLREVAGWIPGCQLAPAWEALPLERYELNTAKLRQWTVLPPTRAAVRAFVQEWLTKHGAGGASPRGAS
jgi:nucleoside-diphosphate-sugar epimerase